MVERSVIVLTNFWDANYLIKNHAIVHVEKNKIYEIDLSSNYFPYSIALGMPSFKKLNEIKNMIRLDVFCPTYDLLMKYKEDSDWDYYIEKYNEILFSRKKKVSQWFNSLVPGKVYFLCCWENTKTKSHCHRQILYDWMKKSKRVSEKSLVIYRDGSHEKIKKPVNQMLLNENPFELRGVNSSVTYTDGVIYMGETANSNITYLSNNSDDDLPF